jgi:predicted Zn-dependent protease
MKRKPHLRFTLNCAATRQVLLRVSFLFLVAREQLEALSDPAPIAKIESACNPQAGTQATLTRNDLRGQQAEGELGKKFAAEAERSSVMLADDLILQYLNRLERKIVSQSNLPGCFAVKVLVDSEPNAFSFPGGFIYVTTGLIDSSDYEGELAAALAHETAHVIAHHMTKYVSKTRIWSRIAFWGGPAGYLVQRFVGPLAMFDLIRKEELEADRLGLQYVVAAGYDPQEFCSLLQKAIPESADGSSLLDRLYETHPTTATRVKRLMFLSPHASPPQLRHIVSTSDYQDVKTQLAWLMAVHHS